LLLEGKFHEIAGKLSGRKFDFVFMNHTLEHVDQPAYLLKKCRELMNKGSRVWIDVPNIDGIGDNSIVEEFFIDKHVSHFSKKTLDIFLQMFGFRKIEDYSDRFNLVVVCEIDLPAKKDIELVSVCFHDQIEKYRASLIANRDKLKEISRKIQELGNHVLLYGGGRILDSLIKYGNLDVTSIQVCDKYLNRYAHGLDYEIKNPDNIDWRTVENVVILARSSQEEITQSLLKRYNGEITYFNDLMQD